MRGDREKEDVDGRTADAATTKSGHPLKFTSARRARTLSPGESPRSSSSRVDGCVEIRSIDRNGPRTRVFPDLRIHQLESAAEKTPRGEVDSRWTRVGIGRGTGRERKRFCCVCAEAR